MEKERYVNKDLLLNFLRWLFVSMWRKRTQVVLTLWWTENQSWNLAPRHARTVWVFWWRFKGDCDTRTRGASHATAETKRVRACGYFSSRSVSNTCTDGNPLRKMHFERLGTWTGRIGPSPLRNQGTSTIQTNGDLETSWAAIHPPQAVPLENDVTTGLEIDCVNTSTVSPAITGTFGSATPAVTVYWANKINGKNEVCISKARKQL